MSEPERQTLNIEMPSFEERRDAFDQLFTPDCYPECAAEVDWKEPNRYACRCCGFPTLIRADDCEMCSMCEWEEGDLNVPDEKRGRGSNGPYMLLESRENFLRYGCMYGPEEIHPDFQWSTTQEVLAAKRVLIDAYLKLLDIDRASSDWEMTWKAVIKNEMVLMDVWDQSKCRYRAAHYRSGASHTGSENR